MKLKTNISFRQIGTLYKTDTQKASIRRRVEDTFHAVLDTLNENFGAKIPRVDSPQSVRGTEPSHSQSWAFFGDHLSLIWDGTYIYCNKSNDHVLQRSSYSGQKSGHLIKMTSLVLPDGYVLDLLDPF